MPTIATMTSNIKILRANGIQIGLSTHHQDQVATGPICASFSVMNTIASKPKKLIPPELTVFTSLIFFVFPFFSLKKIVFNYFLESY